nr:transcription factor jun-B-like isoform X2 [Halyomorpha halys]
MSYNNIEVPYIESREDQNYMLLPYPNTFEDFYPYHPHERSFSCPKMIPDESCTATAEVSSSSDVKTSQADRSPLDEDAVKKQLRRIQNREAASRCRRKKMERISFLRETLNRMYHRCQELMQNINAVEAEVRQLKAACYGQHFAYGPQCSKWYEFPK